MSEQHDNLAFLIADTNRLIRQFFQQRLRCGPLTLAQARALFYVSRFEGVKQVQLADALEIQPMTMARLLDQLSDQQLIERVQDPNDRRAYQIFLTAAAAPHLEEIERVSALMREQMLNTLGAEQVNHFMTTLMRLRDGLLDD
ncbi:MarR family transcriptional regulator [Bowmanella sp. Y26]|uniref:MarR family winged helix-turn-helix transcriptional regulator n=1 Tax=Bowmanella yangjiangensis TaxID=2811230 RepID=UPI001BDC8CB6|nr:MarR family transcriptional regulator [Bowmanella yangjiangensis]MBT1062287.1 MarR family transcriptional regulator [Bowmanella yangjiangensis]